MVKLTIGERIKSLRKEQGLTLEKFGERVGVGKTAICSIENGSRGVTDQMALSICREFGVREEWLRTGEGPMYKEEPDSILGDLVKDYNLNEFDVALLEEYLRLPEASKAIFKDYILGVADRLKQADQEEDEPSEEVLQSLEAEVLKSPENENKMG